MPSALTDGSERGVFQGGARIRRPVLPTRQRGVSRGRARCGVNGDIAAATDAVNRRQVSRLAATVESHLAGTDERVAVLGLSYKPDTNVVEESQGVMLANRLASDGKFVTVFDPAALDNAATFLAPSVQPAASLAGLCDGCGCGRGYSRMASVP